jgi:hypothetical protein
MLLVDNLQLGSNDAEDYKRKDLKDFFNTIFVKNLFLDKLLTSNTFFLIGEKGTGKTAYAVFLANNEYKNTRSQIKYIRETQYQKFVTLKTEKHLLLSDYSSIWRVILLVLVASNIKKDNILSPFSKSDKLFAIKSAIDDYFNHAFSPEIATALQLVENSRVSAELIFKAISIKGEASSQLTFSETKFQTNLQYIERKLLESLMGLKLDINEYLFIDGIDIRPSGIEYKDYLSCIKGLAEATWSLNNDEFSVSNGSKGRFKIVLLLRPDIFQSIGLQNSTNKIMNNSVFLDWRTTYPEYKTSDLFILADKLLTYNQPEKDIKGKQPGNVFDYYLNWTTSSTSSKREYDTPFIDFLRLSYSRPRDIVTIIQILQTIQRTKKPGESTFLHTTFKSTDFKKAFSDYLMGSIKDQLSFYYSDENYKMLLHFLNTFKGHAEFDYAFYEKKYEEFVEYVLAKARELPEFIEEKNTFLQFLYESNLICYFDEGSSEPLIRWCYRERKISDLTPLVEENKRYRFHYGILRALNLGSY